MMFCYLLLFRVVRSGKRITTDLPHKAGTRPVFQVVVDQEPWQLQQHRQEQQPSFAAIMEKLEIIEQKLLEQRRFEEIFMQSSR